MKTLDDDVRVCIYRWFAERGRPPIPGEIAEDLQVSVREAEGSLASLADDHVIVLAPGTPYVWMAAPFSAIPTSFKVSIRDQSWWANCIWDALGIVHLLGGDGAVTADCPDCGGSLDLELANGHLAKQEGVVHFAIPARQWWDDIGAT